jgi:ribosomal protein S18 acetylase RimI-like enzyme
MQNSNNHNLNFLIRPFQLGDEEYVIRLWNVCGLTVPWNDPAKDIHRKLKVNPELFLVGVFEDRVVATVMGGYEGHRGWINYLAVDPGFQRQGLGKKIMATVEDKLIRMGCAKINLQIRDTNREAIQFYEAIGYRFDPVVSMGKRLIKD